MAKTKKLIRHRIVISRNGINDYTLTRFDYRMSDGLCVFHTVYTNLSRKAAFELKHDIMEF